MCETEHFAACQKLAKTSQIIDSLIHNQVKESCGHEEARDFLLKQRASDLFQRQHAGRGMTSFPR